MLAYHELDPGNKFSEILIEHLSRYGDFHYEDKMVVRLSNLCNGNPYTGKMASFIL